MDGDDNRAADPAKRREPGTSVLTWVPFRRLAETQLAHALGDGMVAVALANTLFFAAPIGEARDKVALYLAITMTPFALLSPVIGPWLDRRRGGYRFAILLSTAGRAAFAVLLSSRTDRLTLYPLAFGLLVLSRVHGVSRSALVPDALPPGRQLMWGNAWLAVTSVVGAAVGAGVAATANALQGPDLALWLAAAVFAFGAVPAFHLPKGEGHGERHTAVADYRQLLSGRLRAGGLAMAATRASVGFVTFLFAFLLRDAGESGRGFAIVVTAAAVGGFTGSVIAPVLRAALRESLLLLVSLGGVMVVALWTANAFDVASAALVALVVGFSAGAGRLAFDSLLQHDAPEAVRGRTFARYETIFQLWWVAGAGLATAIPFRSAGGMRTLAVIAGAGLMLSVHGLVKGRESWRSDRKLDEVRPPAR